MTEVVAALIWDKDKFMICQRPAHKARGLLWEFVGGKVEPAETKEQALIRECQEELAITLNVGDIFMDVTHEYPDLTVHLTLFHATIQEGVPKKLEHKLEEAVAQVKKREYCDNAASEPRVARFALVFCADPNVRKFTHVSLVDTFNRAGFYCASA